MRLRNTNIHDQPASAAAVRWRNRHPSCVARAAAVAAVVYRAPGPRTPCVSPARSAGTRSVPRCSGAATPRRR